MQIAKLSRGVLQGYEMISANSNVWVFWSSTTDAATVHGGGAPHATLNSATQTVTIYTILALAFAYSYTTCSMDRYQNYVHLS